MGYKVNHDVDAAGDGGGGGGEEKLLLVSKISSFVIISHLVGYPKTSKHQFPSGFLRKQAEMKMDAGWFCNVCSCFI